MTRPNVLYLHTHDAGRYIQPYGHAVPTPNLQALAEGGVLFRQAFCANPTCSASRASLLTGLWPHCSGMTGLAHRGWTLLDYKRHIIHTLARAGYRSALCGAQHVAPDSESIGYDEILDIPGGHNVETVSSAARAFLRRDHDRPFFLSVGFGVTHRLFPDPTWREDERYCLPPAPLPDTPRTRRDMAAYKAAARRWDHGAGVVLEALDAAGLADNTLVICTTDHGIAFPYMKCNLNHHGCGVMLILRGPGGLAGGKVCDALVSQVDIFPSVCGLLDVEPPDWLQGRSVMPLIRGQVDEIHDEIFTEVTYHAAYEPMRSVRTKRYNYVRRFDDRDRPVLANCDASPSKDVWLDAGWSDRPPRAEQLFDLTFDPNETCDLSGDPACAEIKADLAARLDDYMRRTDDPLLAGPAPLPPDAWANDPDDLHPTGRQTSGRA